MIAPENKIGYVQGLNNSSMNFGMAFAPWLLGLLSDAAGTKVGIWTAIGISIAAALINTPLIFHKGFGPVLPQLPSSKRPLDGEDTEAVEKALRGSFIAADELFMINRQRALDGNSFVIPKVKSFEEDKEDLKKLSKHAIETFEFRKDFFDRILAKIAEGNDETDTSKFCDLLNTEFAADNEVVREATNDLGKWVGDYFRDAGYQPHTSSLLLKQMVLSAFPVIMTDKEYTPENIQGTLLQSRRVMNEYMDVQDRKERYTISKVLGNGGTQQFYS